MDRPHRKPIALCQGDCLIRFNLRSETGQGQNSYPRHAEYCEGRESFDHFEAADWLVPDPVALGDQLTTGAAARSSDRQDLYLDRS